MISCSQSRYKPSSAERAVDKRASSLQHEYILKAREADQRYGGCIPGTVGPVEQKLLSFDTVRGVVFGNFGECSQGVHDLVEKIAVSRVLVAGPQRGRRGVTRSMEGEKSLVVSSIRRQLSVMAIKAQCSSLLGRLECLGQGTAAATSRRHQALVLERRWKRERQAHVISARQGFNIICRGLAMLN